MTWYSLSDLITQPELLVPPRAVIPRFAYEGRLSLLTAREKSGKSTLIRQAVAALVTGRDFLGEPTTPGPVAWLCLDESLGDLTRGLYEEGARHGVLVSDARPSAEELEATIVKEGIVLLVVDTLTELLGGLVDSMNDASQLQPHLANLRGILHRTNCAGWLSHHTNKAGTGAAGSVQIGAGVDVIVTMRADSDVATRRACQARGRGVHWDLTLDWDGDDGYAIGAGELSLDLRVYKAIVAAPGITLSGLRLAVAGRGKEIDAALRGLLHRGEVVDRGTGHAHKYYPAEKVGTGSGQGWDRVLAIV